MRRKRSSVGDLVAHAEALARQPAARSSGSGASRVHSTTPSGVGSPDATPSANGLPENGGAAFADMRGAAEQHVRGGDRAAGAQQRAAADPRVPVSRESHARSVARRTGARTGASRVVRATPRRGRAAARRRPRARAAASARALLALGQLGEAEHLEQRVQVELHRLHAEVQLGGELPVRRRRGEARGGERAAERDEDASLRRAQRRRRAVPADGRAPLGLRQRRYERQRRAPEAQHVAVAQDAAAVHRSPLTNDPLRERPSSTTRPDVADALDVRVRT